MKFALLLALIDARLRELRISERQACLTAGLKADGIRTIRRGHPPTLSKLRRLSEVLRLPLGQLIEASGDLRIDEGPAGAARDIEARERSRPSGLQHAPPPAGYVLVEQVRPRPGSGPPGVPQSEETNPGDAVLLPEGLIRVELRGRPEDFLVTEVEGSSMAPLLESGDRVLIDRRRTSPAEPGIFALDEGLGISLKWVEFIPHSEPRRYRIRAESRRFEPYDILAENASLVGRVVWFSRRI
jgi:phage repressor protein C with HTH and peptisase S24 domain